MLFKINRLIMVVFSLVLINGFILAQDDDYESLFDDLTTDSTAEETSIEDPLVGDFSLTPDFKLSLLGEHEFIFHVPVIPDHFNFETYAKSPKFKNKLGIEIDYKILSLVSHWQLDLIMNEWGDWEKILEIYPQENYIAWSPWRFKFAVGFQKFTWGSADGKNPTDNLNPKDARISYKTEKLPVLSAYVGFFPLDFLSIEAVYIPFKHKNLFPPEIDMAEQLKKKIDNTTIAINDPEYDFTSFVIGGKLNFFLQYIDFSFSYIYNIDPFYSPQVEMVKQDLSSLQGAAAGTYTLYSPTKITLFNRRVHQIGTDFKTTAGIFGIWGEFCFTLTEDLLLNRYDIRNHRLSWTAGFDFNYGPNDDFYFNIQYFGDVDLNYDQDFYRNYVDEDDEEGKPELSQSEEYYRGYYYRLLTNHLGKVQQAFKHGILIKMDWQLLDSLLKPALSIGYTLPHFYDFIRENRYGSLIFRPELDIMPIDSFHIVVGADLFFAWHKMKEEGIEIDETDPFGMNYKNCNVYLEVRYKWGFDLTK